MRTSVINLLEEAKGKMSAYAALLNYRFANLSITAAPEALLSVEVDYEGEKMPIEKAVLARNAADREDQFELFPLAPDYLFPVVKGLMEAHPEYRVELKQIEGSEDEEERYILATVPEVDDARHKDLTDAVKALSEFCDARLEATFSEYSSRLVLKMEGAKAEELEEAKDQLQQSHDLTSFLCEQYRAGKEWEIESAYQRYLTEKAEKQAKLQEAEAFQKSQQAGLQMNWKPGDE